MKLTIIFILISSAILTVSTFVMKMIKKEDRENGLNINDDEYSLIKSLRLPFNQNKRIKKETEDRDYPIDEKTWKKSLIILLMCSGAALILGLINHADVAGPVMLTIVSGYVYIKKSYKLLIAADIATVLILILYRISYSFPLLIVLPALFIFTIVVRRDYKKFKSQG